eukprot:m.97340 g.97340  ORF g.97340 m.97340 type:complete len:297 (-) comp16696_c0_seq2:2243-3133(-)
MAAEIHSEPTVQGNVSPLDPFSQISAIRAVTGSSSNGTAAPNSNIGTGVIGSQNRPELRPAALTESKEDHTSILRHHRNFTAFVGFVSAVLLIIGLSTRAQLKQIGFLEDGSEDFGVTAGLWHVQRDGHPLQTVCGPIPSKHSNSGLCDQLNAVRTLYILGAVLGLGASIACMILPPKFGAAVPAAVPAVLGVSALLTFAGWVVWQSSVQEDFETQLKAEFFDPIPTIDRVHTRLSYSWALSVWAWVWPTVFVCVRLLSPTLDTDDFDLVAYYTSRRPPGWLAAFQLNRVHPASQE